MILMSPRNSSPRTTHTPPEADLIELRADQPFSIVSLDDGHLRTPATCSTCRIRANTRLKSVLSLAPQRTATQ